jgi:hypothetical protein
MTEQPKEQVERGSDESNSTQAGPAAGRSETETVIVCLTYSAINKKVRYGLKVVLRDSEVRWSRTQAVKAVDL